MRINYYLSILCLIALLSCQTEIINETWKGGAIEIPGKYIYKEKNITLYVSNTNDLIDYYVLSTKKDTLLKAPYSFNDFHNWMMYWDKHDMLWVHSSDIGSSIWIKDSLNKYKPYDILHDSIPIHLMPEEIYNNLPSSIQERVDQKRRKI